MYTVGDLMTREVVTLRENDDLALADNVFYLARIRHLPVVDAQGKLLGLVTHRDLLRCLSIRGEYRGRATLARDVMTRDVMTVQANTPLRAALQLMLENKFGCLPVVNDDGHVEGIITEADMVRFAWDVIGDLDILNNHLREVVEP